MEPSNWKVFLTGIKQGAKEMLSHIGYGMLAAILFAIGLGLLKTDFGTGESLSIAINVFGAAFIIAGYEVCNYKWHKIN